MTIGRYAGAHFNAGGTVDLEVPYHPDFIEALKEEVVPSMREWDADRRVWVIAEEVWPVVEGLVDRFGFELEA